MAFMSRHRAFAGREVEAVRSRRQDREMAREKLRRHFERWRFFGSALVFNR
jgi:hypothetical protein